MKYKTILLAAAMMISFCGCNDIRNKEPENTASSSLTRPAPATISDENTAADDDIIPVDTSKDDWALFVVNNENPLPDNYVPTTKIVQGERELDVRCADYAIAMINAAEADGIYLKVSSAYRSIEKQQENIDFYIEWYMSEGMTYEEAVANTYLMVAVPGCSEHNAGIAMDITSMDYMEWHQELENDFDQLPEFDWLQENSWRFGFIMSYPDGKEELTGFPYEPWHYRYVGTTYAEEIHELGITLNEYIEMN